MSFQKLKRGFTLIELLVVIAIIGVLASVVLAALDDARALARDSKRISDIRNIQTALELYYNDHGRYPPETFCDSSIGSSGNACPAPDSGGWDTSSLFYTAFVGGGYMNVLPVDPINDTNYYYYFEPTNDGRHQGYYFRARLEAGNTTYFYGCGGIYAESHCQ